MIEKVAAGGSRKNAATWEHIINDARIITRENIARCCAACNSSKGQKTLTDWLRSAYCKARGISAETVSEVAKQALMKASGADAQLAAAPDANRCSTVPQARYFAACGPRR